jgi:hypothetical protein
MKQIGARKAGIKVELRIIVKRCGVTKWVAKRLVTADLNNTAIGVHRSQDAGNFAPQD